MPLKTLVGLALLSVPVVVVLALSVLNREPPAWLTKYRAALDRGVPLLRGIVGYVTVVPLILASFAGLNLAFDLHPLGIDYHRPWTYVGATVPLLIIDAIGRCINYEGSKLNKKELYSAVYDDWLLWDDAATDPRPPSTGSG